ncbi:hypothetical protein LN042_11280 [Kitasatospora sp. RB6PN24]|uniref:hypothetical protein n=1 Tax=Kitasatospora humi TaxID=2893891 RepID=UPI001E381565|nr:hypothetical protein [Kitasatospora humi]MCC9307677.1 hypothetical protein [Kitasatospora humi]
MPNPLLGSLVDPLTAAALNTAVWNGNTGTVALAAPGRVSVAAASAGSALAASGPYEATGQTLYARVTPALAGTGGQSVQTSMTVQASTGNSAALVCVPGTSWQAVVLNGGVATTVTLPAFDPTAHAWWQLAESSGQWLFSTSPDGFAWTQLAAIAYTWSPHAVSASFSAQASAITGQVAYVEHVNTPAGASSLMPSWPQIRFQVAFNLGGSQNGQPAYVDLSSRLRGSWSAEQSGRQYELDQIQSGQLTLSLQNLDGALDPTNTASPYYPNVVPMRSCRLQAVWPPTRNLMPQNVSSGTSTSSLGSTVGSLIPATGLPPAPTGHTTAHAWSIPASAATGSVMGLNVAGNLTGWTISDPTAFPVTAGQPYTFTCWVAQGSGGDATLQVAPRISWYPVSGARITASVGSAVTVPILGTAWAFLSYTVTAPAGAVNCRAAVQISSVPSVASMVYVTAWQAEQAAAPTPWTAGGAISSIWTGYVERWPQSWQQQGTYGLANLTCVDLLAGLADFTLQPSFQQQLVALGPSMLYPFDEPTGATQFGDVTGQRSARFPWAAPNGGAGASITSGTSVTGSGFVGAAGPVTTISNPSPGSNSPSQAMYISAPWAGPFGPPSTGGWTRVISFRTPVTSLSAPMAVWSAYGPGALGSGGSGSRGLAELYIDTSGHFTGWISNAAGTATAAVSVPDFSCLDGNWHTAVVQLSADGTTWTVACDNHGYQSTTSGDYHPSGCTSDTIGAVIYNGSGYNCFSGDVANVAEIPYAIGNSAAFDLGNGISTGWAGETSAARAQRILTMAGYGGTLSAQSAATPMGGANLGGVDAMSALQLVGDTEAGQVYVDAAGTLWLTGRRWRYLQTVPAVVLGEHQAAGEVPYLGDLHLDYDTTHIYNQAQITNVVPPGAPEQAVASAVNTASVTAYLPRTLQRSINVQDSTQPLSAAQYLVQQYGQPQGRVQQLTINASANPALWATVLALGFGQLATVNRRPPSGPGAAAISLSQFVEKITWHGDDQGALTLELELTPAAPFMGWWVPAPMHTTLALAATAGSNTITLSPLNGAASNPASAALPAGTVLTVGYGTATAEQVTVLSVAATSPGYTSVAVTLTGNLASNHAAGLVVCQPVPAGVTLPAATAAAYPTAFDALNTITTTTGPRAAY